MGDGFAAPMVLIGAQSKQKMSQSKLKMKKEGLYSYLVEIYTEDPLLMKTHLYWLQGQQIKRITLKLQLLSLCYLRKKGIYIKQTDPRGRVEVYLFDVPEDNDNFTCKLYYQESAVQNRVLMSRTATTRAVSPEKPVYTSIPSEAKRNYRNARNNFTA